MGAMASQITSVSIVYLSVCLPVNSHHNEPVKRKMFPLDSVIKYTSYDLVVLTGFECISAEQKTLYKMADEISPKVNSWRPRQNCRHFADDIFKCIFLNENVRISFKIALIFFLEVRINNISSLVKIMAWRRPSDRPLSEPMMISLLTHICVTRPQLFKIT